MIKNLNNNFFSDRALFNLGFRPFFLGALTFSIITVALWMAIFAFNVQLYLQPLSGYQWHAHEMIFGYSFAVIAGFLLTAVQNWTGMQTLHGLPLLILFSLWIIARVMFLFGTSFISIAAIFDLLFALVLTGATATPVIVTQNWRQLGIIFKVLLIVLANVIFYLGVQGFILQGIYLGIYLGFYLVISLIMMLGSRVVPFFIERGVGYPVTLYNPKWLAIASMVLFICFIIVEIFIHNTTVSGCLAAGLFIITTVRLFGWYTKGIWINPLLWGLYISFVFIAAGFLLFALGAFAGVSNFLAIHSLAYGGIGIVTVSMMARVSLGHTGRDIHHPPGTVFFALLLLILGTISRVGLPLVDMQHYVAWVVVSQVFWIIAFLLIVITYAPILSSPRIDGKPG